jgi:hypothetical protein
MTVTIKPTVMGQITAHRGKHQGFGQGPLRAGEQIQGQHQDKEKRERLTPEHAAKNQRRSSRGQTKHHHPAPGMVGDPAPQIRAEDTHHLHHGHQYADLHCGDTAIGKIQTGVRREDADIAVVREEK